MYQIFSYGERCSPHWMKHFIVYFVPLHSLAFIKDKKIIKWVVLLLKMIMTSHFTTLLFNWTILFIYIKRTWIWNIWNITNKIYINISQFNKWAKSYCLPHIIQDREVNKIQLFTGWGGQILKGHWTSLASYLFISNSIEDCQLNQLPKFSADSAIAFLFYEVFCEQHHLQSVP